RSTKPESSITSKYLGRVLRKEGQMRSMKTASTSMRFEQLILSFRSFNLAASKFGEAAHLDCMCVFVHSMRKRRQASQSIRTTTLGATAAAGASMSLILNSLLAGETCRTPLHGLAAPQSRTA